MHCDYLYVIGTHPNRLINIGFNIEEVITHVRFGDDLRDFPTTFASLRGAEEALQEIKDNRNYILFSNQTILKSVIEGNELDVDKLKIYSVGVIGEVM